MLVFRVELRHTPIRLKELTNQIECIRNVGPYTRSRYHDKVNGFSDFSLSWYAKDTMPGPKEEKLEFNPGEHFFGFVNMEQLYKWWKRDYEDLQDAGFYIAQYKVDRRCVVIASAQCAFKIRKAKLIGWEELDQAFKAFNEL